MWKQLTLDQAMSFSAHAVETNKQDLGGEQLGNEGIEAALAACSEDWMKDALRELKRLCTVHGTITADMLSLEGHPQAIGGLFRIAKANKWIKSTGQYTRSKNPSRHSAVIQIWKSLLTGNSDGHR